MELDDILEKLSKMKSPHDILDLRPSPAQQERISDLLEKNRSVGLSPEERQEWERYERVEHIVRMAKARAARQLKAG